MATKVYGISGRTTVEIKIPVGKALLPLVFENGSLDRKTYKPATYSTSSRAIQDMIEGSPLFGKTIKLYKVYGSVEAPKPKKVEPEEAPAAKTAAAKAKAKPAEDAEKVAGVSTHEEAVAYLKKKGAKATDLIDDESMRAFMAKKNITFDNYTV